LKRKKRILLILAISLILIAVIFAIALEKALNSVLLPELVKEILNDESLNTELSNLLQKKDIVKDVQSIIYDQNQLRNDLAQDNRTTAPNSSYDQNESDKIKTNSNTTEKNINSEEKVSNNARTNNSFQNSLNKNKSKNGEQTFLSAEQEKLNISTADQLEAAKIVLSVMSVGEIKKLIGLYKSGKKEEAIQKGINILKVRLTSEQKKRLLDIYYRNAHK
jgi:thiol:disulfide interchange protein